MSAGYGFAVLLALTASAFIWNRRAQDDQRLLIIYLAALAGGLIGAKLLYYLAEGTATTSWGELLVGKSVLGSLLGGYVAVELAKNLLGYSKVTGDLFASVLPIAIAVGRLGCLSAGCCLGRVCDLGLLSIHDAQGVARWPAAWVEMFFNLGMALLFTRWRRLGVMTGQHFHVYMVAYGCFRFLHEFMRDGIGAGPWSAYQLAALLVAIIGGWCFVRRQRSERAGLTGAGRTGYL